MTLQDHDAHNYGAPGGRNSRVELCIVGCVGLGHAFDTFYVRVGLSVAGTGAMVCLALRPLICAAVCILFCTADPAAPVCGTKTPLLPDIPVVNQRNRASQ